MALSMSYNGSNTSKLSPLKPIYTESIFCITGIGITSHLLIHNMPRMILCSVCYTTKDFIFPSKAESLQFSRVILYSTFFKTSTDLLNITIIDYNINIIYDYNKTECFCVYIIINSVWHRISGCREDVYHVNTRLLQISCPIIILIFQFKLLPKFLDMNTFAKARNRFEKVLITRKISTINRHNLQNMNLVWKNDPW